MAKTLYSHNEVNALRPGDDPLYDGAYVNGLFRFLPSPTTKVISGQFRFKRPEDGKDDTLSTGKFRDAAGRFPVPLREHRELADAADKLLARGVNPKTAKVEAKAEKKTAAANTLRAVADSWIVREGRRKKWTPGYRAKLEASLTRHLAPLMSMPIVTIRAAKVSPVLDQIERRTPFIAQKVASRLHAVLDHAVVTGALELNPLPRRTAAVTEQPSLPAVTSREGVGEILRKADAAECYRGIRRAHALAVGTCQRIATVVSTPWTEVDLNTGLWSIERGRMKRKDKARGPHVVPIPPHLLSAMKQWHREDGDGSTFVCPSPHNREAHISAEAVQGFYREKLALRDKHSAHSWRSVLSTWANDASEENGSVVEVQLDHRVAGGGSKTAYDRAARLQRRGELMRWFENELIAARDGAVVLPIKRGRAHD